MTDNNADNADGQSSNLSRRTALALMGTSAVGGAAATSSFSKLTADRPINVDVVSSGADSETGDSGSSELQITNNSGGSINAEITTTDSSVTLSGLTGSSSASISGTNPWSLTGLGPSETAQIEYEHFDSATTVDFDVEAFSNTGGFTIGATQSVSLAGYTLPSSTIHQYDAAALSGSDGDAVNTWTDSVGSFDLSDQGTAPTLAASGINGNQSVSFEGSSAYVQNSFNTDKTQPKTVITVVEATTNDGTRNIFFSGDGEFFYKELSFNNGFLQSRAGTSLDKSGAQEAAPMIVSSVFNTTSSLLRKNGSEVGSGDVGSNNLGGITIGALHIDKHYLNGYIGEVVVYDGVLSDSEINSEEQRLSKKWGISLS